jgi:hypothetical protein
MLLIRLVDLFISFRLKLCYDMCTYKNILDKNIIEITLSVVVFWIVMLCGVVDSCQYIGTLP